MKSISIVLNENVKFSSLLNFLDNFRSSLENLELTSLNLKDFKECLQIFSSFLNLKFLNFKNCKIISDDLFGLPTIPTLTAINFEKCDGNFLKIFSVQPSLKTISIRNDDNTWNGFETSMITYHWYVGIETARINFLQVQTGYLKELTIHQLPYDFDGGKVLKYIIEQMGLNNFYYGKIPLIIHGTKQQVKKFSANEIQIQSVYEMFRQFNCNIFILIIFNFNYN